MYVKREMSDYFLISALSREYRTTKGGEICLRLDSAYPRLAIRDPDRAKNSNVTKTLAEAGVIGMVDNGFDQTDDMRRTPLHLVCSLHSPGQLEILEALCKKKRKCIVDFMDRTALHHALSPDNLLYHARGDGNMLFEIVRILLKTGANVNAPDNEQLTPLHLALDYYRSLKALQFPALSKILKLMKQFGADLSAKSLDGHCYPSLTPLHLAARLSGRNGLDAMKILINPLKGNTVDSRMRTPLHEAISSVGSNEELYWRDGLEMDAVTDLIEERVTFLLENGAEINAEDNDGNTPLLLSLKLFNYECCVSLFKLLFNRGAKTLLMDSGKRTTLLFLACRYFDKKLSELLPFFLEFGDLNVRDAQNCTPLVYALKSPACCPDTLKFLVESGFDVNSQDYAGNTALHYAVESGFDVNSEDYADNTALHYDYAVETDSTKNIEVVRKLLICGGDPNIKNKLEMTPLLMVSTDCNEDLAKLLLDYGADPNAFDGTGCTPLHIIQRSEKFSTTYARILIDYGANWGAKNCDDATPFALMTRRSSMFMIPHAALLLVADRHSLPLQEQKVLLTSKLFSNLFQMCIDCAQSMKSYYLGRSRVTILEFLLSTNEQCARYMRNENIMERLAVLTFNGIFKNYSDLFIVKFNEAMQLKKLLNQTSKSLNSVAKIDLPYCVIDRVIRYLDEYDMCALNKVFVSQQKSLADQIP